MPDELHAYQTPVGVFVVGIPLGQKRPAIWIVDTISGQPRMLGRLDGDAEMRTLVILLDSAFEQINNVITHLLQRTTGDTHGPNDTGTNDGPRDLPRRSGEADGG